MIPGSIIRCARGVAQYASSPPPVDPVDILTPPRIRGRSPSPVPGSPRASRATLRSSSASPTRQTVPSGIVHRRKSPSRRSGQAGKPKVSPTPSPDPRKSAAAAKPIPSPKRGAQLALENGDTPSSAGNGSHKAKKSGTPVATPDTRRGGDKVSGPTR